MSSNLADGISDSNTMRGMATRPVNPQKATSVVGCSPDYDDESVITRLTIRDGKTSEDRKGSDHRGNRRLDDDTADDRRLNDRTGNRGKGDRNKDGVKGHQG